YEGPKLRCHLPLSIARGQLFFKPHIFHAPAVVDAVDHYRHAFHPRIPAGRRAIVVVHRSGAFLLEFAVDLPHQTLAPLGVGLHRLPVEVSLEFAIAIAGIVAVGAASEVLVKVWSGSSRPFSPRLRPTTKSLRITFGYHCVVSISSNSLSM